MSDVKMQRVSTKVADFGEGGGGFKFKEGSRVRLTDANYERKHTEARTYQGKEIPARDMTILKLSGVLPGVDEDTVVSHELSAGNVMWPSEDGCYLVSDKPGAQLNRGSAAGRFLASLLEAGAADGTFTEEHDAARDENVKSLIGMEFNAGYMTVAGDGNVPEYKALIATAVWVAPGGAEGGSEGDPVAQEVAQALKDAIDATKGTTGLPFLAAGTALQKASISAEAKARVVELLRTEEFIQQGVADQLWRFDAKKKLFMKSGA